MKSFAVRFGVDTAIALETLLHLDGILCSITASQGGQWDDIPLHRTDNVWHGSAALLECGPFGPAYDEVTRLKHIHIDTVPPYIAASIPKTQRKIGEMSPYRNQLNKHALFAGIKGVWFTGYGDVPKIIELLEKVQNLGGMGKTGYGRVTGLEHIEIPNVETAGLRHNARLPARTMTTSKWRQISSDDRLRGVVSMQRPVPPYWTGPTTECVSPMQIDLVGTRQEIDDIVLATN
jgi:hypothetical protein